MVRLLRQAHTAWTDAGLLETVSCLRPSTSCVAQPESTRLHLLSSCFLAAASATSAAAVTSSALPASKTGGLILTFSHTAKCHNMDAFTSAVLTVLMLLVAASATGAAAVTSSALPASNISAMDLTFWYQVALYNL